MLWLFLRNRLVFAFSCVEQIEKPRGKWERKIFNCHICAHDSLDISTRRLRQENSRVCDVID